MDKYTAEELRAFTDTVTGAEPERLDGDALLAAGFHYVVALIPKDMDARVRYFGNMLAQMVFAREGKGSPLSVELQMMATALSYLLNSTSFTDGKYHPFDKDEIDRKLRR